MNTGIKNNQLMPQQTQTRLRGTNDAEYQIYLAHADDGNGNDFTNNRPLKSYEEWMNS